MGQFTSYYTFIAVSTVYPAYRHMGFISRMPVQKSDLTCRASGVGGVAYRIGCLLLSLKHEWWAPIPPVTVTVTVQSDTYRGCRRTPGRITCWLPSGSPKYSTLPLPRLGVSHVPARWAALPSRATVSFGQDWGWSSESSPPNM